MQPVKTIYDIGNEILGPSDPARVYSIKNQLDAPSSVPIEFRDDPLALSCAAHRLRMSNNSPHGSGSLNDQHVLPQDHAQANIIRQYYRGRILMRVLRRQDTSRALTGFEQAVNDICDQRPMTKSHLGPLHLLPSFYLEDTQRDHICQSVMTSTDQDALGRKLGEIGTGVRRLAPITKVCRHRRAHQVIEYWFRDLTTNHAVRWEVDDKNPLRGLVEHHWNRTHEIMLRACCRVQHHPYMNIYYWQVLSNVGELWIE